MTTGSSSCSPWKLAHADRAADSRRDRAGQARGATLVPLVSEALRHFANPVLPGAGLFSSGVPLAGRHLGEQLLLFGAASRVLGQWILSRRGERPGRYQPLHLVCRNSAAAQILVMDIESLRRYCLSLPHATEGIQWGNNLLFRIGAKMFAIAALDQTPVTLSFKCTPEEFAELTEREGIIPAPYLARNSWVMLESLDALPR